LARPSDDHRIVVLCSVVSPMVLLCGICLVVSGDFGSRLLFKYPQNSNAAANTNNAALDSFARADDFNQQTPAASARGEVNKPHKQIFYDDEELSFNSPSNSLLTANNANTPANAPTNAINDNNSNAMNSVKDLLASAAKEDVYGLPADEFARWFTPKAGLCSGILDLAVENYRFLSYPIKLPLSNQSQSPNTHEITSFNVILILKCNINIQAIGYYYEELIQITDDYMNNIKQKYVIPTPAIPSPLPVPRPSAAELLLIQYKSIIEQFNLALYHEQNRIGFIAQQTQDIINEREKYANNMINENKSNGEAGSNATEKSSELLSTKNRAEGITPVNAAQSSKADSATNTRLDNNELNSILINKCLLAHHLSELYNYCKSQEEENYVEVNNNITAANQFYAAFYKKKAQSPSNFIISINNWFQLNFTLNPLASAFNFASKRFNLTTLNNTAKKAVEEQKESADSDIKDVERIEERDYIAFQPTLSADLTGISLKPYETLLLQTSRPWLLSSFPADSSPLLIRFVRSLNPCLSFYELSLELDLKLELIYQLSCHLVYWGIAKVIHQISNFHYYSLHKLFQAQCNLNKIQQFKQFFPEFNFNELLHDFSKPRQFNEEVAKYEANEKKQFLNCLIWMLENNLLQQVHMYIFYAENIELKEQSNSNHNKLHLNTQTENSMFDHLLRYFNGNYTVTDILWNERHNQLTRQQLLKIIQSNADLLFTVIQP
jgi:hypothetical protein